MEEYDENSEIIISLTSISTRKQNLITTINSLLKQNTQYKYIILLNLSYEPFLLDNGFSENDIIDIEKIINNPKLKINICKNIGSLRKIVPALQIYKNNIIITTDDDVIYNEFMIETYVNNFKKHNCIIAARCREFKWNEDNIKITKSIVTDLNKIDNSIDIKQFNVYPEGISGILYHSKFFCEKFYNYDFLNLNIIYLKNDDLLLRAYNINIPVVTVPISYAPLKNNIDEELFYYNKEYKICFYDFLDIFYKKIIIGPSINTHIKTIKLDNIYPSEIKIFFFNNLKYTFSYEFNDNNLTITRTDKENCWEQELIAYLY